MGLHAEIVRACAAAAPAIARAALGSEASIYNLRFVVADLMAALVNYEPLVDACAARCVRIGVARAYVPDPHA